MSTTDDQVDMHLEIDVIPVSDVDRAKAFYDSLGWRFDADEAPLAGLRIVQYTPPGSGASITFGEGLNVSDVWHGPPFPVEARQPGRDPEGNSYGSFFSFDDPDGNLWLVQEVTTRLAGRI